MASWLNYIADEHNFSPDERSNTLAAFDSVTGSQLLTMTREQFLTADPAKGGMLHEIFKDVYPAGTTLHYRVKWGLLVCFIWIKLFIFTQTASKN